MMFGDYKLLSLMVVIFILQETPGQEFQCLSAKFDAMEKKIDLLSSKLELLQTKKPPLKCQSGTFSTYSYPRVPAYPMHKTYRFNPPFDAEPAFVYGTSHVDSGHTANLLFLVNVTLDKNGFDAVIKEHFHNLYGITIRWMACPK